MDVSGWLRRQLRKHLATGAPAVSFVIPAGISADLEHEDRISALLDGVLDLVLAHEPNTPTPLLEIARISRPGERWLALRFTREGGSTMVRTRDRGAALAAEARRFGGDVQVDETTANVLTVIVTLATV